jgi:hypothetical protein
MEPTDQVEVSLRRYRGTHLSHECSVSGFGYHNASKVLTRGPAAIFPEYHGDWINHDDPGWPIVCKCGYMFVPDDQWQCNPDALFRRTDTGELYTQISAPAGAMLNMTWNRDSRLYKPGADGLLLAVKLPDGSWWCIDGPACRDGKILAGSWKRTGVPPEVTVTPSIDAGSYHGWLSNGWLRRC